jgi:amino-acid N-acetyltransferase
MPTMIRPAEAADVSPILELVNRYAGQDIMLPRTEESVRNTLHDWLVLVEESTSPPVGQGAGAGAGAAAGQEDAPPILACGALVALTHTLAEVRSLAVHDSQQGKGLGGYLVLELVQMARMRGFEQVCALTLRENFFVRLGFEVVDRWSISPKVWQACIFCRKFHRCDEVAVLMNLVEKPGVSDNGREGARDSGRSKPAWSHLLKWSEWQPLKLAYQQKPVEAQPLDETALLPGEHNRREQD